MPKWTKKDYEMVAEVLRNSPLDDRLDTKDGDRDILVQAFASRFYEDNERFDSSRFDAAVFRGELTHRSTARHGGWTKMDYEMVADVIRESIASDAAKAIVAQMFADRFYYDNPNFKQEMFFRRIFGPGFESRVYKRDVYTRYEPSHDEYATTLGREVYRRPDVRVRRHQRRSK